MLRRLTMKCITKLNRLSIRLSTDQIDIDFRDHMRILQLDIEPPRSIAVCRDAACIRCPVSVKERHLHSINRGVFNLCNDF